MFPYNLSIPITVRTNETASLPDPFHFSVTWEAKIEILNDQKLLKISLADEKEFGYEFSITAGVGTGRNFNHQSRTNSEAIIKSGDSFALDWNLHNFRGDEIAALITIYSSVIKPKCTGVNSTLNLFTNGPFKQQEFTDCRILCREWDSLDTALFLGAGARCFGQRWPRKECRKRRIRVWWSMILNRLWCRRFWRLCTNRTSWMFWRRIWG